MISRLSALHKMHSESPNYTALTISRLPEWVLFTLSKYSHIEIQMRCLHQSYVKKLNKMAGHSWASDRNKKNIKSRLQKVHQVIKFLVHLQRSILKDLSVKYSVKHVVCLEGLQHRYH